MERTTDYRLQTTAKRGFTLIELLIAVVIVALISGMGLTVYAGAQKSARDSKRKEDLKIINSMLAAYYSDNRVYPSWGSVLPGSGQLGCSLGGDNWLTPLVTLYASSLPVDPINKFSGASSFTYCYGFLTADGSNYDLFAYLENTKDPERCGINGWKKTDGTSFCAGEPPNNYGGVAGNNIYSASPTR